VPETSVSFLFIVAALSAVAMVTVRRPVLRAARPSPAFATARWSMPGDTPGSLPHGTGNPPPLPRTASPYPLLAAIDAAAGPGHVPYASARNAAHLERRAHGLAALAWSEHVWLTGWIDRARLDAVTAVLDRERVA